MTLRCLRILAWCLASAFLAVVVGTSWAQGKISGAAPYLEGLDALDEGRWPEAVSAFSRALQFLMRAGRSYQAEEQQAIARQLIHTTGAPLLPLAWNRIEKTAWQGAKAYLTRARSLDPQDARALAYLGVVHESDDRPDQAAIAYRAVIALEKARLHLYEPALHTGKPLAREALDFGLAMQAAFHLARLHETHGKPAEALSLYRLALSYATRMKPGFESRQMFTALWPDQKPEKGAVVIKPENAATMVADAHLGAGKLLSAAGQGDEAIQHFRSAAMFGPLRMAGIPQIGNARGDTNFSGIAGAPAAEAQFYLAKELVAVGDVQGASQVLYEAGRNIPEHLRPEPSRGQMTLFEESGEIGTLWYEFLDRDRMQVTDLEGTTYEARRR